MSNSPVTVCRAPQVERETPDHSPIPLLKRRSLRWVLSGLAIVVALPGAVQADVKLPSIFGSKMVLQRDIELPVWGWAEPGEEVTVSLREQTQKATADDQGNWKVTLSAESAGDPATMTVTGKNTVKFDDVLLGEVWVCSGQSNMEWSVWSSLDPDLEVAAADHPGIRLFMVPNVTQSEPAKDTDGKWEVCSPETIGRYTAVGYYFARQLHETLGVPVAVIDSNWGGTPAEAWTSPEAIAADEFRPIVETWEQRQASFNAEAAQKRYEEALEEWENSPAQNRGRRPREPQEPISNPHYPSSLYNGMIAPIVPYAIRGAIWYQGESNAGRAYQYRNLMTTMIQSWRDSWDQGDFPFYQVQLANFMDKRDQPVESAWAELREAQDLATQNLPNVGAACITDLGTAKDIHPRDKQNVGKRLARLALHDVYGRDYITRQGPTLQSMKVEDGKAVLTFETYGSPLTTYYNQPLEGFAIAGEDRKWVWADAKITGKNTVEVSHGEISAPVAVRYNWADNPDGTLYNEKFLPAYPFRTDDWDGVTKSNVRP